MPRGRRPAQQSTVHRNEDGSQEERSEAEEEYIAPRGRGTARARRNNTNTKTVSCPGCGRFYGSVGAWHHHYNKKHRDTDPRAQQIHDQFYRRIRAAPVEPQQEPPSPERPLFTQDIPTVEEEAKHKINSDQAYANICTAWRNSQARLGLVDISDVLFDSDDLEEVEVDDFADITTLRRNLFTKATGQLIEEYRLQELRRAVEERKEFSDYRVEEGVTVLNFAWDLLNYFKPVFAAKVCLIIQGLCVEPGLLQSIPSWQRFKSREWSKFDFIEAIIKDYHRQWLAFQPTLMHFI